MPDTEVPNFGMDITFWTGYIVYKIAKAEIFSLLFAIVVNAWHVSFILQISGSGFVVALISRKTVSVSVCR